MSDNYATFLRPHAERSEQGADQMKISVKVVVTVDGEVFGDDSVEVNDGIDTRKRRKQIKEAIDLLFLNSLAQVSFAIDPRTRENTNEGAALLGGFWK
jgi:hypothetical protein